MKIRTYTHPIRRFGAWIWQAAEDYPALPFAVMLVALIIINSVEQP